MARNKDEDAQYIRLYLTEEEAEEVQRYLDRHGGKKGPAAKAALLEKVRRDDTLYQGAKA